MRVGWVVVWQLMEGRGAQEPEAGTARSPRVRKRVGESPIGPCADSERLAPKSSHLLLFRELIQPGPRAGDALEELDVQLPAGAPVMASRSAASVSGAADASGWPAVGSC